VWTPKGTPFVTMRVLNHLRQSPLTGHFTRRVRERKKIKKNRCNISRILPEAPLRPICTNFGLRVFLIDAITCAKFYRNWLRCVDCVGSNFDASIGMRCRG